MRSGDSLEKVILGSHSEGEPDTPTKSNTEELRLTFFLLDVFISFLEDLLHGLEILTLNVGHDALHVHSTVVGRVQNLRHIDIVAFCSEDVCDGLVASTSGSEDIRDDEKDSVAFTCVIDEGTLNVESFSLGDVVSGQLWPGTFRTALHKI